MCGEWMLLRSVDNDADGGCRTKGTQGLKIDTQWQGRVEATRKTGIIVCTKRDEEKLFFISLMKYLKWKEIYTL